MITVEVSCYNCGSSHKAPYACENGFSLVKCCDCGLLYVTPRPTEEDIAKGHRRGVHQGESELDMIGVFEEEKITSYLRILRDLYGDELGNRERTWLDIGCGHGEFLVALQQLSCRQVVAKGLEPNKEKQRVAVKWGLDVSYFDLRNHKKQYGAVSLLNVYSHLPNPPEFLLLCKSLIKPGGELLLETGDSADLPPAEHYRPLYLPDHLSFASEKIVTDILQRCGFQIVSLRKYSSFPFECSSVRWFKEMVKFVWPGKRSGLRQLVWRYRRSRKYVTDMYIRARPAGEQDAPSVVSGSQAGA